MFFTVLMFSVCCFNGNRIPMRRRSFLENSVLSFFSEKVTFPEAALLLGNSFLIVLLYENRIAKGGVALWKLYIASPAAAPQQDGASSSEEDGCAPGMSDQLARCLQCVTRKHLWDVLLLSVCIFHNH